MLTERGGARAGDGVTKVFNLRSSKSTLFQVDGKTVEAAEIEHEVEMLLMLI